MEVNETDLKTNRSYTRRSKLYVTGCPLYSYAKISVLLWLVRGGGAACSLEYERETKTYLKPKRKPFRYYSTYIVELEENIC